VLERHRIAERWRSERWDGLRFPISQLVVRLRISCFRTPT